MKFQGKIQFYFLVFIKHGVPSIHTQIMAPKTSAPLQARDIAAFFLHKGKEAGCTDMTNKKIQKLVYYAQAWSLVLKEKPLFEEEIQAWVHGPAIPSLYSELKAFGWNPVDPDTFGNMPNLDAKIIEFLESIWRVYGKFDANYLEILTHAEYPWKEARQNIDPSEGSDNTISHESMKTYYSQKLSECS